MIKSMTFPNDDTLPFLVVKYPECGHCFEEVEGTGDGGVYCSNCRLSWDSMDEDAEPYFSDDKDAVCGFTPVESRNSYSNGSEFWEFGPHSHCILPEGHSSIHLCPYEATAETIEMEKK